MQGNRNIFHRIFLVKIVSVGLMIFCLVFLTSINYLLYSPDKQADSGIVSGKSSDDSRNNFPPSGPTEEKSSTSAFSIIEEFLHDPHPVINFGIAGQSALHGMTDAGKILVYHGELLSPPPEA